MAVLYHLPVEMHCIWCFTPAEGRCSSTTEPKCTKDELWRCFITDGKCLYCLTGAEGERWAGTCVERRKLNYSSTEEHVDHIADMPVTCSLNLRNGVLGLDLFHPIHYSKIANFLKQCWSFAVKPIKPILWSVFVALTYFRSCLYLVLTSISGDLITSGQLRCNMYTGYWHMS